MCLSSHSTALPKQQHLDAIVRPPQSHCPSDRAGARQAAQLVLWDYFRAFYGLQLQFRSQHSSGGQITPGSIHLVMVFKERDRDPTDAKAVSLGIFEAAVWGCLVLHRVYSLCSYSHFFFCRVGINGCCSDLGNAASLCADQGGVCTKSSGKVRSREL